MRRHATTAANNATAYITRTYYPGGALKTDSSQVVNSQGSFTSGPQHAYTIGHSYDAEGRQTALLHPQSLTWNHAAWQTTYAYNTQTGALDSLTDPLSHKYRFSYTPEGQLDVLGLPGGVAETHH